MKTRKDLLKLIDENGGTYEENSVFFKRENDKDDTVEARSHDGKFRVLMWDDENYISGAEFNFLSQYLEHRDFITKFAYVIGFDLGLDTKVEVEKRVEVIKEVTTESEETKAKLIERDRLLGKVDAYENILIGRNIQASA